MYSITAISREDRPDRNGQCMIYIRVIVNKSILKLSMEIKVPKGLFNPTTFIHKDVSNAAYKNLKIRNKITEIEKQILILQENGNLNENSVRAVLDASKSDSSVITIAKAVLTIRDRYKSKIKESTFRQYDGEVGKAEKFHSGPVPLSSVVPAWLDKYANYMHSKLKNEPNTVRKTITRLKSIMAKCKELGIVKNNPISDYSLPKYEQSAREHLSLQEIKQFEDYLQSGSSEVLLQNAKWFILQIYSGLRFGDLRDWDEEKYVNGDKLIIVAEKTNTPHFIPIYPKLRQAIEAVRGLPNLKSTQKYNDYIREIAKRQGINKRLTSHVARHTFACLYIERGGRMQELQKLLGHTKITTTQIYGNISDQLIANETNKVFGDL